MSLLTKTCAICTLAMLLNIASARGGAITMSCAKGNDLFQALTASGAAVDRFDAPAEAIDRAAPHCAVLLLADDYPARRLAVSQKLLDRAKSKNLRLYLEFP